MGICADLKFIVINGNYKVAPWIELIPAPGHSPGSQAVIINTEKGKAVITGFCCLPDNFNPPESIKAYLPVIVLGIHTDPIAAFESAIRIKGLADPHLPARPFFRQSKKYSLKTRSKNHHCPCRQRLACPATRNYG